MIHMVPTLTDVAYAAGIFDGEGTLKDERYVVIGNTYLSLLEWLQNRFGGRLHKTFTLKGTSFYRLELRYNESRRFLEAVMPHLLEKKDRAERALGCLPELKRRKLYVA